MLTLCTQTCNFKRFFKLQWTLEILTPCKVFARRVNRSSRCNWPGIGWLVGVNHGSVQLISTLICLSPHRRCYLPFSLLWLPSSWPKVSWLLVVLPWHSDSGLFRVAACFNEHINIRFPLLQKEPMQYIPNLSCPFYRMGKSMQLYLFFQHGVVIQVYVGPKHWRDNCST